MDLILAAAAQTWPPFVLVAGLLLIGAVASEEGLFQAVGAAVARARIRAVPLLLVLLALDACVTAVLNLDTAVVFLTPVLVHAARTRGLDERPFLYGSVLMANASSTLLPGSNLTNLLVVGAGSGGTFARHMLPAWLAASALTAVLLAIILPPHTEVGARTVKAPRLRLGVGLLAIAAAAIAVLALQDPALPVAAVGVAACMLKRLRPRLDVRMPMLLFLIAVAIGTTARVWSVPTVSGRWATGGVAALASIVVNNLPAAVLFSARPPAHPLALLLGLDLGPNLAVTGSLSAVLWLQAARAAGARPSVVTYSLLGVLVVPPTLAVSLAVS